MKGKDKCELLKNIRRQVAEQYGLVYNPTECQHQGDCAGTCPRCDAELKDLQRQLEEKGIQDIQLNKQINELLDAIDKQPQETDSILRLQGDVASPEPEELEGNIQITEGMPVLPKPERKKTFFKECVVAGWNFHDLEDTWDELYEGTELALVRDRKNKYDRNAVAVALADDYDGDPEDFDFDFILGYVPRTDNEVIAKMMDMGWNDAFTAELTTVKDHGSYDHRLRMTIYIQSKDEIEETNGENLYAILLEQPEYEELKDDLYKQGYIYRRWGGFPVWPWRQLPHEGDKVTFIHKQQGKMVLFLMQVIADNDDKAVFFFDDPSNVRCIDDCQSFILTNIVGPVIIGKEELSWLDMKQLTTDIPESPLAKEEAQRITDIITATLKQTI